MTKAPSVSLFCSPNSLPHPMQHAGRSLYIYMEDFRALDSCRPEPQGLPTSLQRVVSPLRVEAWQRYLAHHPDAEVAQYLLKGMAEGFRIGFDRAARRNLRSTREHQEVVDLPGARGPAAPRGPHAHDTGRECPRLASQPHRGYSEMQPPRQVAPHCRLVISGGPERECWP